MSDWVDVRLVPVEVFGAGCSTNGCAMQDDVIDRPCVDASGGYREDCRWGYGLCDAVSSWSDCNRASGFIFRADDIDRVNQGDGQAEVDARCISVRVLASDLHKFGVRELLKKEGKP